MLGSFEALYKHGDSIHSNEASHGHNIMPHSVRQEKKV
jgi:hypothetical protein